MILPKDILVDLEKGDSKRVMEMVQASDVPINSFVDKAQTLAQMTTMLRGINIAGQSFMVPTIGGINANQ